MSEQNCILLNWNLRGLNNPARRLVLRNMVSQQKATIVCIQESKLAMVDNALIVEAFGPQFANKFCYLPADGTRGRIIVAASADFFLIYLTRAVLYTLSRPRSL